MSKRVLIFSTAYFPLVGGAEVAVKELTDRLTDWEFDLVCAKLRPDLPSYERIGRVNVYRCGFGSPVDKYLLPVWGVWRAMRSNLSQPVFIWAIMASYAGFAALVYSWFRPKTKILLTLQEGDPLERYERRAGVFEFLRKRVFQRANAVQAISRFLGDWAVKMGFHGVSEIVPNGVDLVRFTPRTAAETHDDIRLFTSSRLSQKNGIDDLIRAMKELPLSYRLCIAGEGEDRAMLESLVKNLELQRSVGFVGNKSHEELVSLLRESDIFVRPSLSEGLGNSFLEAMAVGLPIVGTPVGGIPDFLIDGETGVFCQPRNPSSIASAVQRIHNDPMLREKLICNGQALVRETYDWNKIALRMKQLFHSLEESTL